MQLTNDQVALAVLTAAFFAILIGLARGLAAIIQAEFYFWRAGKKVDAYAKIKRDSVVQTVSKGLIDALAGILILAVLASPFGFLDPKGVSVLTSWMMACMIPLAALIVLSLHFFRIFNDSP